MFFFFTLSSILLLLTNRGFCHLKRAKFSSSISATEGIPHTRVSLNMTSQKTIYCTGVLEMNSRYKSKVPFQSSELSNIRDRKVKIVDIRIIN